MNHTHTLLLTAALFTSLGLQAQSPQSPLQFRPVAQPGTTIGTHTFATETTIDAVALNDAGEFAFVGRWPDHAAVFTSQRVVASQGDIIEGKYIASIGSRVMINVAGQVAFEASYSDTKADAKGTAIFVDKHLALTIAPGAPFTLTDDGQVKNESPAAPKAPSVLERARATIKKGVVPSAVPLPKGPSEQRRDPQPAADKLPFPMNRRGQVLIPVSLGSGFLLLLGTPVPH